MNCPKPDSVWRMFFCPQVAGSIPDLDDPLQDDKPDVLTYHKGPGDGVVAEVAGNADQEPPCSV